MNRSGMNTKPRKRKCGHCRELFQPWNTLQQACSPPCALKIAAKNEAKRFRQWQRKERERLKTKSEWTKEAQIAFNAYIRERDRDKPCISCDRYAVETFTGGSWDCGHFRTVGAAPELRFDEANAHKQCKSCNSGVHRSGSKVKVAHDPERAATIREQYRGALIGRIGLAEVRRLEGPQETKKYTIDDLREIRDTYRRKARELKRAA